MTTTYSKRINIVGVIMIKQYHNKSIKRPHLFMFIMTLSYTITQFVYK